MNEIPKQPVEITQELIAFYTTRKEVGEKLPADKIDQELSRKIPEILSQSDVSIKELMNELSNYGDAVKSEVNRDSEYYTLWQDAQNEMDNLSPKEIALIVEKMERQLRDYYQLILQPPVALPPSLTNVLNKQLERLNQAPDR